MSVVSVVLRLVSRLIAPIAVVCAGIWVASGFFDNQSLIGGPIEVAKSATSAVEVPAPVQDPKSPPLVAPTQTADSGRRTSEAELDAALADTLASSDGVKSRAIVSRFGVLVAVSAKLPETSNGFGDFVNIRLTVRPANYGLEITRMAVGRYEIPRRWINPALRLSMDWLPGADRAAALLASIESVDPSGKTVTFAPTAPTTSPSGAAPTPSAG